MTSQLTDAATSFGLEKLSERMNEETSAEEELKGEIKKKKADIEKASGSDRRPLQRELDVLEAKMKKINILKSKSIDLGDLADNAVQRQDAAIQNVWDDVSEAYAGEDLFPSNVQLAINGDEHFGTTQAEYLLRQRAEAFEGGEKAQVTEDTLGELSRTAQGELDRTHQAYIDKLNDLKKRGGAQDEIDTMTEARKAQRQTINMIDRQRARLKILSGDNAALGQARAIDNKIAELKSTLSSKSDVEGELKNELNSLQVAREELLANDPQILHLTKQINDKTKQINSLEDPPNHPEDPQLKADREMRVARKKDELQTLQNQLEDRKEEIDYPYRAKEKEQLKAYEDLMKAKCAATSTTQNVVRGMAFLARVGCCLATDICDPSTDYTCSTHPGHAVLKKFDTCASTGFGVNAWDGEKGFTMLSKDGKGRADFFDGGTGATISGGDLSGDGNFCFTNCANQICSITRQMSDSYNYFSADSGCKSIALAAALGRYQTNPYEGITRDTWAAAIPQGGGSEGGGTAPTKPPNKPPTTDQKFSVAPTKPPTIVGTFMYNLTNATKNLPTRLKESMDKVLNDINKSPVVRTWQKQQIPGKYKNNAKIETASDNIKAYEAIYVQVDKMQRFAPLLTEIRKLLIHCDIFSAKCLAHVENTTLPEMNLLIPGIRELEDSVGKMVARMNKTGGFFLSSGASKKVNLMGNLNDIGSDINAYAQSYVSYFSSMRNFIQEAYNVQTIRSQIKVDAAQVASIRAELAETDLEGAATADKYVEITRPYDRSLVFNLWFRALRVLAMEVRAYESVTLRPAPDFSHLFCLTTAEEVENVLRRTTSGRPCKVLSPPACAAQCITDRKLVSCCRNTFPCHVNMGGCTCDADNVTLPCMLYLPPCPLNCIDQCKTPDDPAGCECTLSETKCRLPEEFPTCDSRCLSQQNLHACVGRGGVNRPSLASSGQCQCADSKTVCTMPSAPPKCDATCISKASIECCQQSATTECTGVSDCANVKVNGQQTSCCSKAGGELNCVNGKSPPAVKYQFKTRLQGGSGFCALQCSPTKKNTGCSVGTI